MNITVLLPTYNNGNYIKHAVNSILNQTYCYFELLIIDDGSTDETKDLINKIDDKRIRYITKEHTGLWDTLNYGLRISKNDLIARMDGDDISLPQRFEKQMRCLKSHPEIDVISSWYAVFENNIKYVIKTSEKSEEIKRRMLLHSEIVHPGLIYKRDKILSLGGYSKYKIEDLEFWLRNLNSLSFYNIQEVLTLVRYREDSNFNSQSKERNREIYSFLDIYQDKYYNQFNLNINTLKGWKEYFYGNKNLVKTYFLKLNLMLLLNPKIILAIIFSSFSESVLLNIKDSRIKNRLKYLACYFCKTNKLLRKSLMFR